MEQKALYFSRKVLYRQAVLLVPIVSVFVVVVLTLYEAHRKRQFDRDLVVTHQQIIQLQSLIKNLDAQPTLTVIPVILQSPAEQPDFIDMLRSRAEQSHVTLTRWANAVGGSSPGAAGSSLPPEVGAINCSIEASGTYNNLRHFLYSLQDAPRLFTLSDMAWSRNDKWPITMLKFNLSRYITMNGPAPARMPTPIQSKAIADSGKRDQVVVATSLWKPSANKSLSAFPSTENLSPGTKKVSDSRGTQ